MNLLAQQFGSIRNPFGASGFSVPGLGVSTSGSGLFLILSNLIRFLIVVAGVYAFWNIILAGYGFIQAGGDPKNISKAWEKIWQSLIGLVIVAGSFVLAVIFGYLIFGPQYAFILISPEIILP